MALFRRIYRLPTLLLWFCFAALLSAPTQFRRGWRPVKDMTRVSRIWSKGVAKIIGLRVDIFGKIPDASGGLVVSNHLSYVDIITHGSAMPLRHSPKSDIAKWPILGWYLGLSRPIWTDRKSARAAKKALRDFTKTMKRGMYLIVYPEGTTTDGKSGILPFKSTSCEAAITGNSPIIPVITRYRQPAGEPAICWYGDMTLLPHVWRLLGSPRIEAELYFLNPVFPEGRSRRELASYIHGIMMREYDRLKGIKALDK